VGNRPASAGHDDGSWSVRTSVTRLLTIAGVGLLAGCSLFGGDDRGTAVSVVEVEVGECFRAPDEVATELTEIDRVDCDEPHEQEAYANVPVADADGRQPETYPGDAALKDFADGACAERFADYVGVDYRDSSLYFTYLLPTARGWETEDRSVTCFITTTGEQLTESVQGSER
jgi:hypothetical protein